MNTSRWWAGLLAAWACSAAQAQSLAEVVREALAQYPAVRAARALAASSDSELDRAKAARWPVVGIGATAFEQEAVPRRLVATPQAQYTVYAGGGIEAGIARAEALQRAAQGKTASTLDEVGLQAAEAYIAWARQLEIAHLARENLQALQRIRDDVRRIVEVDAGRMVDLSQAEVRVNAAALAVEQREGELAQAAARLARYWPRPLPDRPEGLDEEPGGRPASLGEALAYAGERHPLLAQGLAQAQAAEAALTQARAQMRPRVELQVAHQLNPYTLRPGLNTQLQVNMPVFDAGSGVAGVAAADAQARAARATADEQALLVRERITAAWSEWQSALRRQALHDRQDLAATKVVEGYQLQFRLARRSLLDLLNVQAEAHGYAVAAAGARAEARLARFRLAAALAELGRTYGR
jgi:adhesin transport system outer membrane protein